MIETLTSDGGILVVAVLGIAATAVSIVRDTQRQRSHVPVEELPVRQVRS